MSKRKSKAITIGKSENKCKFCGNQMVTKRHPEITKKQKQQYFYFKQWDYCSKCGKVFFDEKYRVITGRGSDFEDYNRQQSFLRDIGQEL